MLIRIITNIIMNRSIIVLVPYNYYKVLIVLVILYYSSHGLLLGEIVHVAISLYSLQEKKVFTQDHRRSM